MTPTGLTRASEALYKLDLTHLGEVRLVIGSKTASGLISTLRRLG